MFLKKLENLIQILFRLKFGCTVSCSLELNVGNFIFTNHGL